MGGERGARLCVVLCAFKSMASCCMSMKVLAREIVRRKKVLVFFITGIYDDDQFYTAIYHEAICIKHAIVGILWI